MNYHQTPEEIIKAATPAQRILWNHVFLQFGERVGVSQLFYEGVIAGSEFLTYNARKLYFGIDLEIGYSGLSNSAAYIDLYNELNAANFSLGMGYPVWDTTGAVIKYVNCQIQVQNHLFSRLTNSIYSLIKFNGYRLSI